MEFHIQLHRIVEGQRQQFLDAGLMDPCPEPLDWTQETGLNGISYGFDSFIFGPASPGFHPASPGSRAPSVASSYGSIASGVSHPPRAGNKRKKGVEISWGKFNDLPASYPNANKVDEFDDFGKGGDESKPRKRARKEEPDGKRFACPFYKRHPHEFKEAGTCPGPGWSSVHRVKEHILRRHIYTESQCPRCCDEFATKAILHDHQRADNPCEKKSIPNRINVRQEKKLRSRRVYQKKLNEEEKWNAIYKIIFPDAEVIPSPYYEPESPDDLLAQSSHPGLCFSCIEKHDTELPEDYRTLFMSRLPTLVRTEVGRISLDPGFLESVETAVRTALGECLPRMYQTWSRAERSDEDWTSEQSDGSNTTEDE